MNSIPTPHARGGLAGLTSAGSTCWRPAWAPCRRGPASTGCRIALEEAPTDLKKVSRAVGAAILGNYVPEGNNGGQLGPARVYRGGRQALSSKKARKQPLTSRKPAGPSWCPAGMRRHPDRPSPGPLHKQPSRRSNQRGVPAGGQPPAGTTCLSRQVLASRYLNAAQRTRFLSSGGTIYGPH